MKIFLAITALIGVAVADIGITAGTASGYHYNKPQATYGLPLQGSSSYKSYSSSSNTGYSGGNTGFGNNAGFAGNTNTGYTGNAGYAGNTGYTGNAGYTGYTGSSGYTGNTGYKGVSSGFQGLSGQTGSQYNYRQGASNSYLTPTYQHGSNANSQYVSGHQYQSDVSQKYAQYYTQQQQQPTQVFKHFYVHAAPEEPEQPKFRQPPVLPAPQKHYKIIFIKTPSQPAPAPQFIPVQQQNEEKTIVYVLAPKQHEAPDVVVPHIEHKPPTKPEVFFIKYNDKEGSQHIINNIVNDYNKGQSGSVSYSGVGSSGSTGGSSVSDFSSGVSGGSSGSDSSSFSLQSDDSNSGQVFGQIVGNNKQAVSLVSHDDYNGGGSSGQSFNNGVSDSFDYNTASAEANTVGVQSGGVSSDTQAVFNTVSTSQGVPHESYGIPKFRAE